MIIKQLIHRYPALSVCEKDITDAKNMIISCYESGGKLLLAGNGGSSADCDHIVGELMKGFLKKRPLTKEKREEMKKNFPLLDDEILNGLQGSLPAISLQSATALNSAFSNDENPDLIYAEATLGFAKPDDILIAISTSGNSRNVVNAAKVAKALGAKVISLTGRDGGALKQISDVTIIAPEYETFKIQELHLPIYHAICAAVEDYFFKN